MDIGLIGVIYNLGVSIAAGFIFWCILSSTLHEYAHAWVATRLGDPLPRLMGRLTLNPAAHFVWWSFLALVLFGVLFSANPVYAGYAGPYRPNPLRRIAVFSAGPAVNLVLFLACWCAIAVLYPAQIRDTNSLIELRQSVSSGFDRQLLLLLILGANLNGFMAIWSLLPLPGFDGAHLLGSISRSLDRVLFSPIAFRATGYICWTLLLVTATNLFGSRALWAIIYRPVFDWGYGLAVWLAAQLGN